MRRNLIFVPATALRATAKRLLQRVGLDRTRLFAGLALSALALSLCGASPAAAQSGYTFVNLGRLGGGDTTAYGVNKHGQVVGGHHLTNGTPFRAFVYLPAPTYGLPAGMNDLGLVGDGGSARSINDVGEVVGAGFIWLPAANYGLPAGMSDLNTVPEFAANEFVGVDAYDINNSHVVTGSTTSLLDGTTHGFAFDLATRVFTDLGTATLGRSMNNNALPQVVGNGNGAANLYSFVDGLFTNLSPIVIAQGVNDAGAVAGTSAAVNGVRHALYRSSSGVTQDLGSLSSQSSFAYGINNGSAAYPSTVVVGSSYTRLGEERAIRWCVGGTKMEDLNSITTGLGTKTVLRHAQAVGDGGHIVGYCTVPTKGGGFVFYPFLLFPQ